MQELTSYLPHLGGGALAALCVIIWRLSKYVTKLENRVESQDERIKRNEEADAERDANILKSVDEKLKHQKELNEIALSKHEQKDNAILDELKDHKDSSQRNFDKLYDLVSELRKDINGKR